MTLPSASRKTEPCICPLRPTPATSAGLRPAFARTARTVATVASHQRSGSCSDQPGPGVVARVLGRGRGEDRPRSRRWRASWSPTSRCRSPASRSRLEPPRRSPHRRTRGRPPGSRRGLGLEVGDRDGVEREHVVVMRDDEPRPDPIGQVDRLGRRHVPRHAPRRVAAVDRQEQDVERLRADRLGQPVVSQGVAAVIEPQAVRPRRRTPDKDGARGRRCRAPRGPRGRARTRNPGAVEHVAPRRSRRADRPAARAPPACPISDSGSDQRRRRRGGQQVGERPRVEVVGVLVAGEDEVDARSGRAPRNGGRGHPDVGPVGALVFRRQVLGEVRVDDERGPTAT